MNDRVLETTQRVIHHAGIAKPEASWDDYIAFSEVTTDSRLDTVLQITSMRQASVRVTSEFMRDAMNPLETVGCILDEESQQGERA